ACDQGDAVPPDNTITTDSAGVVIVESFRPDWEIEEIDAATRVTLSLGEGPNGYPLGNVTQALRLGDGRIVFVDFQSSEVKSFLQGEDVRVIAGRGEGPGEFLFPGNLQRLAGDSVQVYDRRQGRVSVFSPEGEFAYGISVQKAGRRPPTSMMRAGPQLLIGLSGMTEERRLLAKSDVADLGQTPVAVRTFDLTGREQDTEVALPGFDAIEDSEMCRAGWREIVDVRADGPGSGIFGLENDPVACVVRWGQPSYVDDDGEIIQSETLSIHIQ
ncbi:MAG: hypothetical protein MUO50_14990, partial [Longimicrobiales bacterium]|nr:hypothetical protein [Longimicrobiales bacterium]